MADEEPVNADPTQTHSFYADNNLSQLSRSGKYRPGPIPYKLYSLFLSYLLDVHDILLENSFKNATTTVIATAASCNSSSVPQQQGSEQLESVKGGAQQQHHHYQPPAVSAAAFLASNSIIEVSKLSQDYVTTTTFLTTKDQTKDSEDYCHHHSDLQQTATAESGKQVEQRRLASIPVVSNIGDAVVLNNNNTASSEKMSCDAVSNCYREDNGSTISSSNNLLLELNSIEQGKKNNEDDVGKQQEKLSAQTAILSSKTLFLPSGSKVSADEDAAKNNLRTKNAVFSKHYPPEVNQITEKFLQSTTRRDDYGLDGKQQPTCLKNKIKDRARVFKNFEPINNDDIKKIDFFNNVDVSCNPAATQKKSAEAYHHSNDVAIGEHKARNEDHPMVNNYRQLKFLAWVKKMYIKKDSAADGKGFQIVSLMSKKSNKEIAPKESFEQIVVTMHRKTDKSSQVHLSVADTITEIRKVYTFGRRDFGMSEDFVRKVILKCSAPGCIAKELVKHDTESAFANAQSASLAVDKFYQGLFNDPCPRCRDRQLFHFCL